MHQKFIIGIVFLLFMSFVPYGQHQYREVQATVNVQSIGSGINQLIHNEPSLKGGIAGISIRSATTGEIIYQYNGTTRLSPASNMKILTAASALSTFGENYTFQTELLTDGVIKGDQLDGNLYLKGKGDPTLLKKDFDRMALNLKYSGIKTIFGNLIADDTWYDDIRYSRDLVWNHEGYYYGAAVSALTASPNEDFDSGSIIIEISPGKKVNEKAKIGMQPENNQITIINNTKTTSPKGKNDIRIHREHGSNVVTIEGNIPEKAPKTKEWIAVWNPTQFALDLFKQSLDKHNILLLGSFGVGKTPEKTDVLVTHSSMPLKDLLVPFMKLSNNGHAEVLVKEMGKIRKGNGSWDSGIEVVKGELSKYGINPNQVIIRDGSGLSQSNLIAANDFTSLLYSVQKESWFPTFYQSLPLAGNSDRKIGGTLRNRLKNPELQGKVFAKTGTIQSVSSLSGYITTKNGDKLIFSILLNNLMDEYEGKKVEDKIVTLLYQS